MGIHLDVLRVKGSQQHSVSRRRKVVEDPPESRKVTIKSRLREGDNHPDLRQDTGSIKEPVVCSDDDGVNRGN